MKGARGPYSAVSRPPAPPARTLCLEPYRQPAASPSASGKCGGSGPSSLFCGAENSILSQWKTNKHTNGLVQPTAGPPSFAFACVSAPGVCTPRFVYLREIIFFSTVKTLPALSPSIIGSLSFVLDARLCLFRHVANSHPAPLSRGASEHQAVPVPRPPPTQAPMASFPRCKILLNAVWSVEERRSCSEGLDCLCTRNIATLLDFSFSSPSVSCSLTLFPLSFSVLF